MNGAGPQPEADALVIFGITGDLARKKTFIALYALERSGLLRCPVIGVAVDAWSTEQLRARAREAITAGEASIDERALERLAARLAYVGGDLQAEDTYTRVGEPLRQARAPVFYLEIPPSLFAAVVAGLARANPPRLGGRSRAVSQELQAQSTGQGRRDRKVREGLQGRI